MHNKNDCRARAFVSKVRMLGPCASGKVGAPTHDHCSAFVFDKMGLTSKNTPRRCKRTLSTILPLRAGSCDGISGIKIGTSIININKKNAGAFSEKSLSISLGCRGLNLCSGICSNEESFRGPCQVFSKTIRFHCALSREIM